MVSRRSVRSFVSSFSRHCEVPVSEICLRQARPPAQRLSAKDTAGRTRHDDARSLQCCEISPGARLRNASRTVLAIVRSRGHLT
jgi:hypothetical protein